VVGGAPARVSVDVRQPAAQCEMGATTSTRKEPEEVSEPTPVILHIYNVGTSSEVRAMNKILRVLGTGAFHCGVEVYSNEWSYRGAGYGLPGVFSRRPKDCEGHVYSESVKMGMTVLPRRHVHDVIRVLSREWPGHKYDLLKFNCCHFCNAFCQLLGVGRIPTWITNLAGTGAALVDTGTYISRRTKSFGDRVDTALCGQVQGSCPSLAGEAMICGDCFCGATAPGSPTSGPLGCTTVVCSAAPEAPHTPRVAQTSCSAILCGPVPSSMVESY